MHFISMRGLMKSCICALSNHLNHHEATLDDWGFGELIADANQIVIRRITFLLTSSGFVFSMSTAWAVVGVPDTGAKRHLTTRTPEEVATYAEQMEIRRVTAILADVGLVLSVSTSWAVFGFSDTQTEGN